MVHFIGAGPGDPELLTLRGAAQLRHADVLIYAGSLVHPALLSFCKDHCRLYNSAEMTLEQVLDVMAQADRQGLDIARLHTGDPSLYGAIQEQMAGLTRLGIAYDVTPGVSSFCGAAAAVGAEYTLPNVTQTLILTRMPGRTPVPERESISALARHGCSMVIFLSAGMLEGLQTELLQGSYTAETPAALVYKATWPEERVLRCTLGTLAKTGQEQHIQRTALVLVGDFLSPPPVRSRLYAPDFETGFRQKARP